MGHVRLTKPWKAQTSEYHANKVAEATLHNLPISVTAQEEMELRRSAARKTAWDNRFVR